MSWEFTYPCFQATISPLPVLVCAWVLVARGLKYLIVITFISRGCYSTLPHSFVCKFNVHHNWILSNKVATVSVQAAICVSPVDWTNTTVLDLHTGLALQSIFTRTTMDTLDRDIGSLTDPLLSSIFNVPFFTMWELPFLFLCYKSTWFYITVNKLH